jgi:hypothetical protein
MGFVHSIEKQLEGVFKNAPKIPENGRKTIAEILPWIALVFGVLQLFAVWGLWGLTRVSNELIDWADQISKAYGGQGVGLSSTDKTFIYLGILVALVDAVILLLAFSPLKSGLRKGWDLLFLSGLISVVYAVVNLFIDARGFGGFLFSLLFSAVGFWILFQVKDKFKTEGTKYTDVKK